MDPRLHSGATFRVSPVVDCRVLLLSTSQVVPEERDAEEIAEKENVIEVAGDQPAGHDVVDPVVLNPWCNHGNEIL